MLLRGLAGRVQAARAQRGILVDQLPDDWLAAPRATVLEDPIVQVGSPPRQRVDRSMLGTVIAPLPVNHHRRRQHQTADPGGEHLRQQHRGGEIVVAAIGGCVGGVDAGTHHGGLVTHQIDTGQQRGQRAGVAHVDPLAARWQHRVWPVRGGQQRVDAHHVVTRSP